MGIVVPVYMCDCVDVAIVFGDVVVFGEDWRAAPQTRYGVWFYGALGE